MTHLLLTSETTPGYDKYISYIKDKFPIKWHTFKNEDGQELLIAKFRTSKLAFPIFTFIILEGENVLYREITSCRNLQHFRAAKFYDARIEKLLGEREGI